ncbi:element excision factor XisH family protein [Nostoc sp.]|uniref:element excision factor XisH family protein n=1 Tax=Nostoc sp. TaxID=1180 RepID=UPI002FFB4409
MTEPLFVWALFQTPAIRYEISRRATGTSGSMKNISQEKVFGITTIIPPLPIQKEFAHRVEAVEKLKALNQVDPERDLYLAISEATYSDIFSEPIGKLAIAHLPLKLIIVDLEKKEVSQWIPSRQAEKSSNR